MTAMLRRPLRMCARAFSTGQYSPPPLTSVAYDLWLQETAQLQTSPATIRSFLGVASNVDPASLTPTRRRDVVGSPEFVNKISSIAQWGFQAHGDAVEAEDATRIDEIQRHFEELMLWGNMAKGDVWQHFYIRRFFLSRAPLETFLMCYEVHRQALETTGESFLPLPSALLMRELCWRGRFDDALAAYSRLDLDDTERRNVTTQLYDYEQYETLRQVYAVQDRLDAVHGRAPPLLDPVFILEALKELGRRDELMDRFESLSHEDQGRADIQKLLLNA